MKLVIKSLIILAILASSCHKEPEIIVQEPQLTLDQCGPLQYRHSMFIINNECWGVNEPPTFEYSGELLFIDFSKVNMYTESLIIHQISNEKPFPKTWSALFAYSDGYDGTYASYSKRINIDSSNHLKIIINEDSNIIEGTISNLTMVEPAYEGGRFPTKIVISEGSFRTSVKK